MLNKKIYKFMQLLETI